MSPGALDPLMERWVRDTTPEWQRILREAEAKGQERRAAYARWMLGEVLVNENSNESPKPEFD